MFDHIDIIYFTLFPWDNAYSSVSLSFTREFAKHNRVFYVNPPYTSTDILRSRNDPKVKARLKAQISRLPLYEQIPNLPENVFAMHPPSITPINWLSKGVAYNTLHKRNNQVVYKAIRQLIKKYNIKDYIYLNCFNPSVAGVLPKSMNPLLNIYQCIDDMWQETYTAKHWATLEEQVIAEADIATVTSRQLYELKHSLNPNTYIVHNAVDDRIFKRAIAEKLPKPAEIAAIKTPIIGFTGNMDGSRIDYPLLKKIAEQHPDKTLVLVGPTNSDDYLNVGLPEMPNVVFTGSKDINDLPAYLQHFDCLIIPFLCNELTASIYPLKINEYLFSGKPVISTNFSVDIRGFASVINLAESQESFIAAIGKAINNDDEQQKEARIAVAQSNTWTSRVQQLWEIIEKHL